MTSHTLPSLQICGYCEYIDNRLHEKCTPPERSRMKEANHLKKSPTFGRNIRTFPKNPCKLQLENSFKSCGFKA